MRNGYHEYHTCGFEICWVILWRDDVAVELFCACGGEIDEL